MARTSSLRIIGGNGTKRAQSLPSPPPVPPSYPILPHLLITLLDLGPLAPSFPILPHLLIILLAPGPLAAFFLHLLMWNRTPSGQGRFLGPRTEWNCLVSGKSVKSCRPRDHTEGGCLRRACSEGFFQGVTFGLGYKDDYNLQGSK